MVRKTTAVFFNLPGEITYRFRVIIISKPCPYANRSPFVLLLGSIVERETDYTQNFGCKADCVEKTSHSQMRIEFFKRFNRLGETRESRKITQTANVFFLSVP